MAYRSSSWGRAGARPGSRPRAAPLAGWPQRARPTWRRAQGGRRRERGEGATETACAHLYACFGARGKSSARLERRLVARAGSLGVRKARLDAPSAGLVDTDHARVLVGGIGAEYLHRRAVAPHGGPHGLGTEGETETPGRQHLPRRDLPALQLARVVSPLLEVRSSRRAKEVVGALHHARIVAGGLHVVEKEAYRSVGCRIRRRMAARGGEGQGEGK